MPGLTTIFSVIILLVMVTLTLTRHYDPPQVIQPMRWNDIEEGHRNYSCTFDDRRFFPHGSVFRFSEETRCITYLCDRGQIYIHTEGCINEDDGMCTRPNHWFVKKRFECHYFMCTKNIIGPFFEYRGNRVKIECIDPLTDECRGVDSTFDTIDERGIRRRGCTCNVTQNSTSIVCPNAA